MSNDSLFLSIILFIMSLFFQKKAPMSKANAFFYMILAFSAMLLYIIYGVAIYFTGKAKIDEVVLYHLKYGLGGAGFLEYTPLIIAVAALLLLSLVFSFSFFAKKSPLAPSWVNRFLVRYPSLPASSLLMTVFSYSLLSAALLLNPVADDLYGMVSASSAASTEKAQEEAKAPSFYDYYRKPSITPAGTSAKNIVFIYAESLERTYFDETLFPGLIKGLRKLEVKSTYFTDIRQAGGTGWTIAGMTASQCGIPLVTPADGNTMSGMDKFLPSAVCLGDLLRDKGYRLTYYGGADLHFAGKGKFYTTHGFAEVSGKDELLLKIADQEYKTHWGLYDDSLFDLAFRRFSDLSESGRDFGLFLLTLDTHHPNGHQSKSCRNIRYKDGSNPILNAVACSDYLITNFVNRIIESPYADRTVIVVASDHLSLRNSAYDLLNIKERKNLFMIIDPLAGQPREIRTTGSTLDIGATLLPFIGYQGALGLGRNLLDQSEHAIADIALIQKNLTSWNQPVAAFWDYPRIQDSLDIDVDKRLLHIDKRSFRIPVLVELNNDLETTLSFDVDRGMGDNVLLGLRRNLSEDAGFFLIDECRNVRKLDKTLGKKGLCLLAGRGNKYFKIEMLDKNVHYTSQEIRWLLKLENGFLARRVAHAGGGLDKETYTNSYEALTSNSKKGFHYFELDFTFTKDDKLVCLHDWQGSFNKTFGFETRDKLTLKEFETLARNKAEFQPCTLGGLISWMRDHPSAFIVTDVKDDNEKALRMLLKALPDAKRRIIPQIYDPVTFPVIKKMGFEQIIWTLYRYPGTNDQVLEWVDKFAGPIAVTMPVGRAVSFLPKALKSKHIPTYVHTVNSSEEKTMYTSLFGVTEVYTDFLPPYDTSRAPYAESVSMKQP